MRVLVHVSWYMCGYVCVHVWVFVLVLASSNEKRNQDSVTNAICVCPVLRQVSEQDERRRLAIKSRYQCCLKINHFVSVVGD